MFWKNMVLVSNESKEEQLSLLSSAMNHCGSNNIKQAQTALEDALNLSLASKERPCLQNGALIHFDAYLESELMNSPVHVQIICQLATFYGFFLSEYRVARFLFAKIFTPECLQAIIKAEIPEGFAFLEENAMNYAELICERASDEKGITNENIINFIVTKYQQNPKNLQCKRLFAKIQIDKFVQSTKENPDLEYDPVLLQNFGVGVRLMLELKKENPADLVNLRNLEFILDTFNAMEICNSLSPQGDKPLLSEPNIRGAVEVRTQLEECLSSVFGKFEEEKGQVISLDGVLPQLPEGRIIIRSSDCIKGKTTTVVHTQGLSFPYLPSEYEEAAIYFGGDEMETDDADSWVQRARLPLPLNWSGFGYELCVCVNNGEYQWAVEFLREFCCDIISYNSDMLTKICWEGGALLKTSVSRNGDEDSEEDKDEDPEELCEDDENVVELNLLLTKASNFSCWEKLGMVIPYKASPGVCFMVVAVLITPEQYTLGQDTSVSALLGELSADCASTLDA